MFYDCLPTITFLCLSYVRSVGVWDPKSCKDRTSQELGGEGCVLGQTVIATGTSGPASTLYHGRPDVLLDGSGGDHGEGVTNLEFQISTWRGDVGLRSVVGEVYLTATVVK